MGSTNSVCSEGQFKQHWKVSDNNVDYLTIWENRHNPSKQLQQYYIPNYHQQRNSRLQQIRKNHPHIVNGFLIDAEGVGWCHDNQGVNIYVERIPLRLSNIEDIPYPDTLHLFNACVLGFEQLSSVVGYFRVDEDQVGVNLKAEVKVWLNVHFESSEVVGSNNVSQHQMVQDILQIIFQNSDNESYPPNIPNLLSYIDINTKDMTFSQIKDKFNQYINQYVGSQIPNALECVHSAGGPKQINNWCRNNSSFGFQQNSLRLQRNLLQSKLVKGQISNKENKQIEDHNIPKANHEQNVAKTNSLANPQVKAQYEPIVQQQVLYNPPQQTAPLIPIYPKPQLVLQPARFQQQQRSVPLQYRQPMPLQQQYQIIPQQQYRVPSQQYALQQVPPQPQRQILIPQQKIIVAQQLIPQQTFIAPPQQITQPIARQFTQPSFSQVVYTNEQIPTSNNTFKATNLQRQPSKEAIVQVFPQAQSRLQQQRVISQTIQVKQNPTQQAKKSANERYTDYNNYEGRSTENWGFQNQTVQKSNEETINNYGRAIPHSINVNEQRYNSAQDGKSSADFLSLLKQLKTNINSDNQVYSQIVEKTPASVVKQASPQLNKQAFNYNNTSSNYNFSSDNFMSSQLETSLPEDYKYSGQYSFSKYERTIDPDLEADLIRYK